LAVSGSRLRARLGFSIPSAHSGQRGVTPAFGYGTPHPSAGGTSTLLICALPGAHYGPIRHLARPSPSLTGCLLSRTALCSAHLIRLPLLRIIPFLRACCRHYPGGPAQCTCCSLLPQHRPSPSLWWVGTHVLCFEACSTFAARYGPHGSLTLLKGLFSECFSPFVTSWSAPRASGWSNNLPGGIPTR
jgi:hypothetical protein